MKRLELVVRPEALDDLRAVMRWYDDHRLGLSMEFMLRFEAAVDSIAVRPRSFPIRSRRVRRALLRRFPYAVYFRIDPTEIVVLAVAHTARSDWAWKRRR